MATYHYTDSPLLERVEFHKLNASGAINAVISVSNNAAPEQLEGFRKTLGANGFSTMMDTVNGHEVIQVRGIKDEKSLIASLEKSGIATGTVNKESTIEDSKKQSLKDKVRTNSLFLSAIFYDIGNAAFIVSGIQRGRHNKTGRMTANDKSEIMIGAAFGVGDLLMTKYGQHDGDEELVAAAEGLKNHLKENNITLPEGSALNPDSLHQSGAAQAINEWMKKNIAKVKAITEIAGGGFTMHAALKPGERNNGKLAAGALLSSGWLATMLLDKPTGYEVFDGDKPPATSIAGKAAENPRGWIARPLSVANNISNLWGSLNPKTGERLRFRNEVLAAEKKVQQSRNKENLAHLAYAKAKQHDYAWNVVSAASFIVANTLFGLSGSGRPAETEDDKAMMDDLVLMAANTIASQPDAVRKEVIDQTADYVSHLSHVTMDKAELKVALNEKIDGLKQSKWANRVAAQQTSQTSAEVQR